MNTAVAGVGSISAAGRDTFEQWNNLLNWKKNWNLDPVTGLAVYPVTNYPDQPDIKSFCDARGADRSSLLALYAANEAVRQAQWTDEEFAILVGCSRGPTHAWEENYAAFAATGQTTLRSSPSTTLGSIGFALADYFGSSSLASSLSVTCSSGMHALLHGVALLQSGMVDRVLVGGTEASLTPFTLRQMEALRVYAKPTDNDQFACRPLDRPATGMAIGEGAAFLAIERAKVDSTSIGLSVGFAREQAGTATGITSEGLALQRSMQMALAGNASSDLIVAHAPGTRRGDEAEQRAVDRLFNEASNRPLLTTGKWATGHTFGASGPLGMVMAVEMLRQQQAVWPPYLDRPALPPPHRLLVNATGFGGNAVSVLLDRHPG
jgi:3-oxoacyl-(acyl-carrier-protein) synthase